MTRKILSLLSKHWVLSPWDKKFLQPTRKLGQDLFMNTLSTKLLARTRGSFVVVDNVALICAYNYTLFVVSMLARFHGRQNSLVIIYLLCSGQLLGWNLHCSVRTSTSPYLLAPQRKYPRIPEKMFYYSSHKL